MASQTAEDAHPPPTFEGQLKLSTFTFNGGVLVSAGPRRSPRLSATATPSSAATPSPAPSPAPTSRSPSKRKAVAPAAADSDDAASLSSPSSSPAGTPTRNKAKRARQKVPASYAPPSTYAHLPHLPDAIAPNLLIFFIGLNPGIQTARTGHAYAHPTNLFWRLLYSSGITPRLCSPTEDRAMPALYSLGLTNIVSRPSRNGAELSKEEMDAGVEILEEKVRRWRPEVVCVVGKSIWESLWRVRHGRAIKAAEFKYGWQDEAENMGLLKGGVQEEEEREEGVDYSGDWKGARIFVATSTSGLAATLKPKEKEEIWRQLGEWTVQRRTERAAAAAAEEA
ncbi:G/U mismatch-specific uracil DNA glycosylase [Madurella mycetomatis]|uniref:G/U mismatch-specific uracil DNA glycosylase n=1 Tax=Madurella mycetomatis TaxID=100816 RepID=A0A175W917_9PEZI|nr:G/U mismatch-specific uracil DNA glycosylase [Madurella mycetomatis]